MKMIMTVLVMLLLVGLTGCGKSEKDYIGKYVRKSPHSTIKRTVLEIKQDHTWESRSEYKDHNVGNHTCGGPWEITEGKIVLHGSGSDIAYVTIRAELKGSELVDHHDGNNEVFIKQD